MATEVVDIATESEEDVIIDCVAIFYEEGKEGENFRRAVQSSSPLNVNSLRDKKVTIPEEIFIPRSTTSTGSSKVISHPM